MDLSEIKETATKTLSSTIGEALKIASEIEGVLNIAVPDSTEKPMASSRVSLAQDGVEELVNKLSRIKICVLGL